MMLASSLDASHLVSPSRALYPGSVNTACLRRSFHAPQTRVFYTRPSAVDCPALNAFSSSTRRTTPRWLPCSRPPMRRREGIARAAASPSSPATDDSDVVAHVGPLLLTRQDCIRYIVPAAGLRILTSCLDGKGILLLAQGTVMVMTAAALALAVMTTLIPCVEHWKDNWLYGASIMACFAWACEHLVTGFWRQFIVPITVSYPFYTGTLPVLAPAALFIKQHPAVAAGCYSVAKGIPYALSIAAAVAIVRRAAARRQVSAAPSQATGPAAGTGGPVVARDASMPEAVTALQAEHSVLRARLDDLAKRLGAVEDYSGDDEAQNMPLRRVGEVEHKLAQVARLLASEIEELKEALATQKARENAPYLSSSDLEGITAHLQAADARHAQLLQEVAGKADAASAAEQETRITESLQQVGALRQQLLEHSRLHSAAQAQLADFDRERLDAAERALEDLRDQKWVYSHTDHAQGESVESRLEMAEAKIAALQRSSEEAAEAAAAAASGGNSFQARLFQAEERIKGLACLVEEGLSNSEGDIAELQRRLDGCAEGQEDTSKGSMEDRLRISEVEIAALKRHVGGFLFSENGEDCLENRVCRAEAQLYDLKETAKGDAQVFGEFESRLKQAEDEIIAAWEHLYGDSDPTCDVPEGNVLSRLAAAEHEIRRLQEVTGNHDAVQQGADELAEQLKDAQGRIEGLWDLLGPSATAEAPCAQSAGVALPKQLGPSGSEEVQGKTVLSRLEAAERTVARLQAEMTCRHSEAEECAAEEDAGMSEGGEKEEAEDDTAMLRLELFGTDDDDDDTGVIDEIRYWLDMAEEFLLQQLGFTGLPGAGEELPGKDVLSRLEGAERTIARLQEEMTCKHSEIQENAEECMSRLEDAEDDIAELREERGCGEYDVSMGDISPRVEAAERKIIRLQELVSKHDTAQQGAEQLAEQLNDAQDHIRFVWDLLRPSATDEALALGTRNAIARLNDAGAEIEALKKRVWFNTSDKEDLNGMSAVERVSATEWLVRDLQRIVAEDSEAAQGTAEFLSRLEKAEDNIAALKQQRSKAGMDAAEAKLTLSLAEERISKLTTMVNGVADMALALPEKTKIESSPDLEGIPEAKWREWLERGVPKSQWHQLWMKDSKDRPETGPDGTSLEQRLQDIQNSLHSELKGDYWGLDIKGFQAKGAAVGSKAAQQVKAPAESVAEDSGLQLVKPRPAPELKKAPIIEPEKAKEDEDSTAWNREGVTSEKIQPLKRTLDTRTPTEAQPATSKTVPITWEEEEEEASAKPTSSPSKDTAEPQVAGKATAYDELSAAVAKDTGLAAESAAAGGAAADDMAAVVADAIAAVDADVSNARMGAQLAAADAATAAAAAAARAGAVAAAAVSNAQLAADTAATGATAAAAASMAAAAATDADVALTAANADVGKARPAADLAAADSAGAAAAAAATAAAAAAADVAAANDVSGMRTAAELAAAFSEELDAQWASKVNEAATKRAAVAARQDQRLRSNKQAASVREWEVPIQMFEDISDQPTSEERAITGSGNGVVGDSIASGKWPAAGMAQVDTSCLSEESEKKPQPKAAGTADDSGDVSDDDSFDLDVETDKLWNLMVDAIESSEKPQRTADATADDSGDVSDKGSFDLDVELWDSLLASVEESDEKAQRKAGAAADDSDEGSFDLDVETD